MPSISAKILSSHLFSPCSMTSTIASQLTSRSRDNSSSSIYKNTEINILSSTNLIKTDDDLYMSSTYRRYCILIVWIKNNGITFENFIIFGYNPTMSTLNLELGFNVPRQILYEALIDQQYIRINSEKSCSTPGLRLLPMPRKVENSPSLKAGFKAVI